MTIVAAPVTTVLLANGLHRVVDAEGNNLGTVHRLQTAEGERWVACRAGSSVPIGWTHAATEQVAILRVVTAWEEEHQREVAEDDAEAAWKDLEDAGLDETTLRALAGDR